MKKKLLIYGSGGLGCEILSWVHLAGTWEGVEFVDDFVKAGTLVKGVRVLGNIDVLNNLSEAYSVVIAFGDPALKQSIIQRIINPLLDFPVLIHPRAVIQAATMVHISRGSVICAGVVMTTDIEVGQFVLINLNTTVGHDVKIGDYTSIMPGVNIAGNVMIGTRVLIGSGANIRNRILIGDQCTVGMGSVVIKNVAEATTVAGVPAKPLLR
jgi:sugar O-acyltransferase (sialic acid O-acetyltransferase NeuD family)